MPVGVSAATFRSSDPLPHVGSYTVCVLPVAFSAPITLAMMRDTSAGVYPISHAIMASAAFPFIFHNVTLRNYTPDFGFDDLRDPGGLALKIWDSQDGVSRLIRAHLDPTTRGMLAEYRGAGVPSR